MLHTTVLNSYYFSFLDGRIFRGFLALFLEYPIYSLGITTQITEQRQFNTLPAGVLPPPPSDLVLTTRLLRKYYKNRQLQISLSISSVYIHVNSHCARAAFTEFTHACCQLLSSGVTLHFGAPGKKYEKPSSTAIYKAFPLR